MFELLNLPSNYRTVKQQAEGSIRKPFVLCEKEIVRVADYVVAVCLREQEREIMCICVRFIHICTVPITGSVQWWPIVGTNDNRLYLALQAAQEQSPLFLSFFEPDLSFPLIFTLIISLPSTT